MTGFIFVLSLFIPGIIFAEDLKDIKPPVYFPPNYILLVIILVIIMLCVLIFLIRYLLNKFKHNISADCEFSMKPAHQIAYEAFEALKAKELPARGLIKEYYIELSDIIRHYIENRFDIQAPEMTTEEFLGYLRNTDNLTGTQKNLLKDFLNQCDLVKFAKYGPDQKEINDSFVYAKRFVDETKPVEIQVKEEGKR